MRLQVGLEPGCCIMAQWLWRVKVTVVCSRVFSHVYSCSNEVIVVECEKCGLYRTSC